jgi:terminase large subunit-like protein
MTDFARYLADPVLLIADLVLEDGRRYGQCWEPWQHEFFVAAFAVEGGRPRHRLLYSERRRGESKTEDAAAVALADLLTGPPRHRSYAVAADQEQAGLILDSVRGFVARTPMLAGLDVGRVVVRNAATGAELRVMSADDRTSWGIRPRRVIFDELSLQPAQSQLWTSMWSAVAKLKDAQLIALSMAGWDFTSTCWQVREMAASSDVYWFQTRQDTEPAGWLDRQAMAEQAKTLHPADFARFWECRWVEPKGSWITREMFDRCVTLPGPPPATPAGARCCGFVDVGLVHDATAVAVCYQQGESIVLATLETLQGSRSRPVELAALEGLVEALTRRYGVQRWVFEAPQAAASVQRLQGRLRCEVELRYPTADTQARLFGTLYQLFAGGRLVLYPHEQLRRESLNLVTRQVGGRLKVVDSSAIHQDHVVALGGAAEMVADRRGDVTVWTMESGSTGGRDFRWVGNRMVFHDEADPETVEVGGETLRLDDPDYAKKLELASLREFVMANDPDDDLEDF